MSTHQTYKDKLRSGKCRHFCFPFDTHNYCPTCRESGKGDDSCVPFENPCQICGSFTEEQMLKISQRKRYIKNQKGLTCTSKDDELDLLGDDLDSFTGSNADLESAADNLFNSPPHPQPLPFSSLSLKIPAKTVPSTPGTALQKLEAKLEKSLGDSLTIHLQQQMGSFQASMLEAFQSLRDELTAKKQVKVDQTSASASKPGSSQAAVNLDLLPPRQPRAAPNVEEMEVDYGPALPLHLGADYYMTSDQPSSPAEEPSKKASVRPKTHSRRKHDIDPRSVSVQYNDDSNEPSGLESPLGLSLTKTNLNMIQTPLIIGK